MTIDEQVASWVQGQSLHNDDRDECCPDFSCCEPGLLAPTEERESFKDADEKERGVMLMTFLGRLIARQCAQGDVHIAGRTE